MSNQAKLIPLPFPDMRFFGSPVRKYRRTYLQKSTRLFGFSFDDHYFYASNHTEMEVKIEESWRCLLQSEFDKPYFAALARFVRDEYRTYTVCPVNKDLFRVFNLCPFDRVKAVILGQDPYPDPRFYYGICFSVPDKLPIPGSLQNIFREVHDDTGRPIPTSGRLERWVRQGVLPMNSILTVRAGESGSHAGHGWEEFTDAVFRLLNDRREHLVLMLWGAYAQRKGSIIDRNRHLVLTAAHPSPRSADRGFFGCCHFSRANEYLRQHGLQEIEW